MVNAAIIGFGYIGSVIGASLAEKGCKVVGIDVNAHAVALANRGQTELYEPGLSELFAETHHRGLLRATTSFEAVADASHVIITVGTPLGPDLKPDLSGLRAASAELGRHLKPGAVVVLKSTVVPGVTRDLVGQALERASGLVAGRDFYLAYSPERIAEGRAISEFKKLPIVVGADDDESLRRACAFWKETLGVETLPLHSSIGAEIVKLADNVWIDLNIALANQISKVCLAFGADFDDVARAANSLPKGQHHVNILQSSIGVGGSCLTKDPHFFAKLLDDSGASGQLIRDGRAINDGMPQYTVSLVERWLEKNKRTRAKVGVFGLAFKNDTNDLRFTPVKSLLDQLRQRGISFVAYDPHVAPGQARGEFGIEMAASAEDAARDCDVLCFACAHEKFRALDLDVLASLAKAPSLFVDGRHSFDRARVSAAGFHYLAI